ncbi:SpaA isopeptide-forming pilin-related protein [Leifsonia sp. NPDC056665]|uniref:DUF7933 domain-containing protein n=1 Tax=Leifsonia sp. NPDC056665 TaxID=3345901 RepID=UPI0036A7B5BC
MAVWSPTLPAQATTPGTPGVTQPGTTVFNEDFENNPAASAVNYSTYVGTTPAGETYTGSPKWINGARCNGVILDYANVTTPAWAQSGTSASNSGANGLCSDSATIESYQFLRMLALAMGQQFTPGSPTTDHVVSSYTECQSSSTAGGACDTLPTGSGVATGSVMFKTVQPIATIPGHYYVFGVNTAYMNCGLAGADPGYQFATVDPITNVVTNIGQPLDGCQASSNPNVTDYTQTVTSSVGGAFGTVTKTVAINSMTTNQAFQATGTSMGLEMYNTNGTTNGNDGAFDNVRLVDVTPQIDKSFTPALIAPGQTSTVTLTVTNTSELDAKNDWSITDNLPAGVVIAPTPAVGGTCAQVTGAAFVRTAVAGTGVFSATGGDLAQGQASCTLSFNVTAAAEGTYVNGPGNIVSNLNPPANATLVVRAPRITLTKALGAPRESATDQFTMAILAGGPTGTPVNSTANSTTTGTGSTVTAGTGTTGTVVATAGTAYTMSESASGTTSLANYTATITCTDSNGLQTGLPNGALFNPASPPTITPVAGANISCTVTNTAQPIISYAKTVDKGAGTLVNPGDTLTYTVSIINSGSVPSTVNSPFDDLTNVLNNATFNTGSITITPAGTGAAVFDPTSKHLTWTGSVPANTTVKVSYSVTINAAAFGQVQNAFMGTSVTNPIGASLQWRKIDATASKNMLSGAAWALTPVNAAGQPTGAAVTVTDCVSSPCTGADTNPAGGLFLVKGLTPGTYQLVETKAPVGYVLNSTPIPVTVSATTQTTVLVDVVNQQAAPIVLPLTGGLGTDVITYWSLSLLGAAAVLMGWQLRRRSRTRRPR